MAMGNKSLGDTTLYEVLGVSNNATDVEVTRAIFQFCIKTVADFVAAPVYVFVRISGPSSVQEASHQKTS